MGRYRGWVSLGLLAKRDYFADAPLRSLVKKQQAAAEIVEEVRNAIAPALKKAGMHSS